jgi:hypothetical protein
LPTLSITAKSFSPPLSDKFSLAQHLRIAVDAIISGVACNNSQVILFPYFKICIAIAAHIIEADSISIENENSIISYPLDFSTYCLCQLEVYLGVALLHQALPLIPLFSLGYRSVKS